MIWELEEIARQTLERADMPIPIHPDRLARALRFRVRHTAGCDGALVGRTILVDDTLPSDKRSFAICHEIGHFLSRSNGLQDTEWRANYLGSALLLPRFEYDIDLRRLGWDLFLLKARHRHASFEALARRIVALRDARAVIFDRPLPPRTEPAKWRPAPWDSGRPTRDEKTAAREAALTGAPVELRPGLTAWPILQHDWHRVITVVAT